MKICVFVPFIGSTERIKGIRQTQRPTNVFLENMVPSNSNLTKAYKQLLSEDGPLSRIVDVDTNNYEMVVTAAPDSGHSFLMPFAIAQWLTWQGHEITDADAEWFIWSTGQTLKDAQIEPASFYVKEKIDYFCNLSENIDHKKLIILCPHGQDQSYVRSKFPLAKIAGVSSLHDVVTLLQIFKNVSREPAYAKRNQSPKKNFDWGFPFYFFLFIFGAILLYKFIEPDNFIKLFIKSENAVVVDEQKMSERIKFLLESIPPLDIWLAPGLEEIESLTYDFLAVGLTAPEVKNLTCSLDRTETEFYSVSFSNGCTINFKAKMYTLTETIVSKYNLKGDFPTLHTDIAVSVCYSDQEVCMALPGTLTLMFTERNLYEN